MSVADWKFTGTVPSSYRRMLSKSTMHHYNYLCRSAKIYLYLGWSGNVYGKLGSMLVRSHHTLASLANLIHFETTGLSILRVVWPLLAVSKTITLTLVKLFIFILRQFVNVFPPYLRWWCGLYYECKKYVIGMTTVHIPFGTSHDLHVSRTCQTVYGPFVFTRNCLWSMSDMWTHCFCRWKCYVNIYLMAMSRWTFLCISYIDFSVVYFRAISFPHQSPTHIWITAHNALYFCCMFQLVQYCLKAI